MEDESFDDVDIPGSRAVIHDAFGVEVRELGQSADHLVLQARKDSTHKGLVAAMDEEDIWAWNNGEKWGDTLPEVGVDDN